MRDQKAALILALVLGFLSACSSFEQSHPWGPGGSVFWDKVKGDKSVIETRPIDRNDPFWQKSRGGW